VLTFSAVKELLPMAEQAAWYDAVGLGRPVEPLPVYDMGADGAYGALERNDDQYFRAMAEKIAADGWIVVDLFGEAPFLRRAFPALVEEARGLWPHMTQFGPQTPSGAPRGDRGIFLEAAKALAGVETGKLAQFNELMNKLGARLARVNETVGQAVLPWCLHGSTDCKITTFPGEGSMYGAHIDGTAHGGVLKQILYLDSDWRDYQKGELHLWDDAARCWRTVAPRAGHLIFFRADVLHAVRPAHFRRHAMVKVWYDRTSITETEKIRTTSKKDLEESTETEKIASKKSDRLADWQRDSDPFADVQ
jgi:predicted 2-oxoglutarate/Fe(II)-dependent dioxygenase YbiX